MAQRISFAGQKVGLSQQARAGNLFDPNHGAHWAIGTERAISEEYLLSGFWFLRHRQERAVFCVLGRDKRKGEKPQRIILA